MSKSRKIIVSVLAIVIALSAAAIWYMLMSAPSSKSSGTAKNADGSDIGGITLSEVEKHTGRDGNSCWVVVDDTVYEISGFAQWADGVHSPSGGKARCGKDLTAVMDESTHGRSKLKLLKEVGRYQP